MALSDSIPLLSTDLIRDLDERFPLRNPGIQDTIEYVHRKAGQRDVVEFLLSRLAYLEDNPLEP